MGEKKRGAGPGGRGAFYRLMRDWHGYFSAAAFLALLFFAATGILLNHPGLLPGPGTPYEDSVVELSPPEVAQIRAAPEPGRKLIELVSDDVEVVGPYVAGDISGPDLFTHTEGLRGSTDLRANLETGRVEIMVVRANVVQVMNGLHTGELTPLPWKLVIDVVAGLLIALSIIGYILFFSLKFRIRTALVLTGVSLAAMAAVFVFLTP